MRSVLSISLNYILLDYLIFFFCLFLLEQKLTSLIKGSLLQKLRSGVLPKTTQANQKFLSPVDHECYSTQDIQEIYIALYHRQYNQLKHANAMLLGAQLY